MSRLPTTFAIVDRLVLEELLHPGSPPGFAQKLQNTFTYASTQFEDAIVEALKTFDKKKITYWAHRLKSGAQTLGANRLADTCDQLERISRTDDDATTRALASASLGILRETAIELERELSRFTFLEK